MAFRVVKSLAGFLLLLNFCIFVIVGAIAGWALNNAIDHTYSTGPGTALPVGFSAVYFPRGNGATGFMVIFSLIAAVVGAASCLSGFHHLRVWTAQSLASSAASSMTAWALTLLAMGLACKEIHIGGRNTKLITLESFLIILCAVWNKALLHLTHSWWILRRELLLLRGHLHSHNYNYSRASERKHNCDLFGLTAVLL